MVLQRIKLSLSTNKTKVVNESMGSIRMRRRRRLHFSFNSFLLGKDKDTYHSTLCEQAIDHIKQNTNLYINYQCNDGRNNLSTKNWRGVSVWDIHWRYGNLSIGQSFIKEDCDIWIWVRTPWFKPIFKHSNIGLNKVFALIISKESFIKFVNKLNH